MGVELVMLNVLAPASRLPYNYGVWQAINVGVGRLSGGKRDPASGKSATTVRQKSMFKAGKKNRAPGADDEKNASEEVVPPNADHAKACHDSDSSSSCSDAGRDKEDKDRDHQEDDETDKFLLGAVAELARGWHADGDAESQAVAGNETDVDSSSALPRTQSSESLSEAEPQSPLSPRNFKAQTVVAVTNRPAPT